MTTDTEFDFSGLTTAQQWVLTYQGWAAGCSMIPQPRPATVAKLIERGLVIPHDVQWRGLTVREYEVPIRVHMAWCFHCSEQEKRGKQP